MTKYETTLVFDGSLPEETIAKEQQAIEALVKEKGALISVDTWGKKELAYEINKKRTGFYSLLTYEYEGDANELIAGTFRYNENVIRHMTVVYSNDVIVKKVAVTVTEEEA